MKYKCKVHGINPGCITYEGFNIINKICSACFFEFILHNCGSLEEVKDET